MVCNRILREQGKPYPRTCSVHGLNSCPPSITERYLDIKDRLKKHDAARKVIEGELLALQHECDHPNIKVWHDSGWGRMPSTGRYCPDCGYSS